MARYRKKPVIVEAFQWTNGPDQTVAPLWIAQAIEEGRVRIEYKLSAPPQPHMAIATLEGVMHASPGDYIIKGIAGEIYPCKPEIFEATYEEVDE